MNIFVTSESLCESVKSLDDRRLIKQILECMIIHRVASSESEKGYAKHPVVKYYANYPEFVSEYGLTACIEYKYRFGKPHEYEEYFSKTCSDTNVSCKPFYAEYGKDDPRCIRTTENVYKLFQDKLQKKWDSDKVPPKWTKRNPPKFYTNK